MAHHILTDMTASITELKKNPMETLDSAGGGAVAILNRNEPVFYCLPPKFYEALLDMLEDVQLVKIVKERAGEEEVEIDLSNL